MPTTMTTKGQVTIPKLVRDRLGLAPGAQVSFRLNDSGEVIIERADGTQPPNRLASLRGIAGPGMSTDELMALLRGEPE